MLVATSDPLISVVGLIIVVYAAFAIFCKFLKIFIACSMTSKKNGRIVPKNISSANASLRKQTLGYSNRHLISTVRRIQGEKE